MKIRVVIPTFILLFAIASCNTQRGKVNSSQAADSILFITKDIALYDDIDSLLNKGKLCYNTQYGGKSVVDTCYNGIAFQQADINSYCDNSKIIRNICFGSYCSINEIQNKFNKLTNILNKKYGKPRHQKQEKIHNNEALSTSFTYQTKDVMALLVSTSVYSDKKGTIILIFTVPQDSLLFQTFL